MDAPQPLQERCCAKQDAHAAGLLEQQARGSDQTQKLKAAGAVGASPGGAAAALCHQCAQGSAQPRQHDSGKPRWRGVIHSYACAAMLSAGAMLVVEAQSAAARWCALVYVSAAAFQFFISGLYHTGHWEPGMQKLLQRIDHSAIFALIAATYTPLVAIPLGHDPLTTKRLLVRVWVSAVAGGVKTCMFPHSPRLLSTLMYIAMGWFAVPYLPLLRQAVDTHVVLLIMLGGVLYTVGALVYAMRYPDPWPTHFGFHEIWHSFVVLATVCHFAACYHVVVVAANRGMAAEVGGGGGGADPASACWQHLVVAGA